MKRLLLLTIVLSGSIYLLPAAFQLKSATQRLLPKVIPLAPLFF